MSLHRASKTNGTFFQDIPKREYIEYKKLVDELSRLNGELSVKVDLLAKVRTKYVKYLRANPHKDGKNQLEKEVEEIRASLIAKIPKKY